MPLLNIQSSFPYYSNCVPFIRRSIQSPSSDAEAFTCLLCDRAMCVFENNQASFTLLVFFRLYESHHHEISSCFSFFMLFNIHTTGAPLYILMLPLQLLEPSCLVEIISTTHTSEDLSTFNTKIKTFKLMAWRSSLFMSLSMHNDLWHLLFKSSLTIVDDTLSRKRTFWVKQNENVL